MLNPKVRVKTRGFFTGKENIHRQIFFLSFLSNPESSRKSRGVWSRSKREGRKSCEEYASSRWSLATVGACKHAYNACARSHDSYARYTRAKPWRARSNPTRMKREARTHTRARQRRMSHERRLKYARTSTLCACTHAERRPERRERRVPDALEACTAQNRYGESSRIISFTGLRAMLVIHG